MTEAEEWLKTQPRNESGKVDLTLLIAESQRRGYCICPKRMRQFIIFNGAQCAWCGETETQDSYAFWYRKREQESCQP